MVKKNKGSRFFSSHLINEKCDDLILRYLLAFMGVISIFIFAGTLVEVLSRKEITNIGSYVTPTWLKYDLQYLSIFALLLAIMYFLERKLRSFKLN